MAPASRRAALAAALAAALLSPTAAAHSPFPGLEGLYVGFLHPLTQPAQILLLLTLGLLVGATVERVRQRATVVAIGGVLAGLTGGAMFGLAGDYDAMLCSLVMFGAAGVLYRRTPGGGVVACAGLAGLALGVASVPDPGGWRDMAITSAGSGFGVAFFALLATGAMATAAERGSGAVFDTARRVAAAWLLAISGLYAALLWQAPAAP